MRGVTAFLLLLSVLLPSFPSPVVAGAPETLNLPLKTGAAAIAPTVVGHVGGAALSVAINGNLAYVGCGPRLHVVDVTDAANPVLLGRSPVAPGLAMGIAVQGGYAYVAGGQGGVWIVDVSDPTSPTLAGRFEPSASWFTRRVAVSGNYAYVTSWVYGSTPPGQAIQILNVSDPAHPILVASYSGSYTLEDGVYVDGDVLYYASGTLHIVDVSDPAHPTLLGSYEPVEDAYDVRAADGYAFVAAGRGLVVLDVHNPASPTLSGTFDVPGYSSPQRHNRVALDGGYVYLANREDQVHVLDVTDRAHPTLASVYSTPGMTVDMTGDSGRMYLAKDGASYEDGYYLGGDLHIIDLAEPTNLVEAGIYGAWGSAEGLSLAGQHLYAADRDGLHTVDTLDADGMSETSFLDTEGTACDVYAGGGHALLADGQSGVRVFDLSDPASPVVIGVYDTPGTAVAVVRQSNYAYVLDHNLGMRILDLADPAHPVEVGFFATDLPRDVAVKGERAFLMTQNRLYVLDVSDPAHPQAIGSCGISYGRRVAVEGNFAYLTVYGSVSGMRVVDVQDAANPVPVGLHRTTVTRGVAVAGGRAFVGVTGVQVVDVNDPQQPALLGQTDLYDAVYDITIYGDRIYAAAGRAGVFALSLETHRLIIPLILRWAP